VASLVGNPLRLICQSCPATMDEQDVKTNRISNMARLFMDVIPIK
jgi:hypothetical protein